MRGCLTPFMAVGRLQEFLDELMSAAYGHVCVASVGLDGSEVKALAEKFNAA